MPGFESDEEEEPEDLMAMEGSDGQQYVVLEVIQLADGDEQMADDSETELIASSILPNSGKINSLTLRKFARLISINFEGLDEDVIKALQSARRITKVEDEEKVRATDMQNCFGFDDVSF